MTLQLPINDLTATIPVLRPDDAGYAEAVTTMTGEGRPDLVVRPRTAVEVAATVLFARDHGLPLTVRAGGHSVAGLTTASGGVLLDLRLMTTIKVDPTSRLVRVGGGTSWDRVARELQPHGLGLTAGDTGSVGVGGLTLGGGIGWMVRRHGLAIDSLVGAEIVTADGKIRQASADQHADLFWALRGGGGNFGVVTRFDFVAHPVTDVVFGTVTFALDDPLALLTGWRDFQRDADERLTTVLTLVPAMGEQPAVAMLGLCFAGDHGEAHPSVESLLRLGTVLSNDVGVRPYADVLENADRPAGLRFAVHNTFVPDLGVAALADIEGLFASGRTMLSLRAMGGAVSRVADNATAFAHRSAEAMVVAVRPLTEDLAPDEEAIPGWSSVARYGTGSYVNFLSSATDAETAASYPTPTLRRLARAKADYDPDNLFRQTVNVRPEGAAA